MAYIRYNKLADERPDLLAEWNYEKNIGLSPYTTASHSGRKVWWICKNGHEWQTAICQRTRFDDGHHKGTGCPYCSNKRVSIDNNLESLLPDLAKEWHSDLNGYITPRDVTPGSNKYAWWQCKRGHTWRAIIVSRANGSGCPYCKTQSSFPEQVIYFYVEKIFNDAINRYKIGKEADIYIPSIKVAIEYDGLVWHRNKIEADKQKNLYFYNKGINLIRIRENGLLEITDYKCINIMLKNDSNDCLSVAIAELFNIIIKFKSDVISHNKLYEISNLQINISDDYHDILERTYLKEKDYFLTKTHPELVKEWNYIKNGKLLPEYFTAGTRVKLWWICRDGHEWQAEIANRTKKNPTGCPYCSNQKAYEGNNLFSLRPDIALEWHPNKNGDLTPKDVVSKSTKKVWWICEKGHKWQSTIGHRVIGRNCPYCAGQKVCLDNCLETLEPELSKQWNYSKNGVLIPAKVVCGTHKIVWWICEKGHEWQAEVKERVRGRGCPFCAGKRVETENSLLKIKPDIASQWHPTHNLISPADVTVGSNKKVWWQCIKGHEWQATIASRSSGCGCPYCSNRKANYENCLETLRPDIVNEWHPTLNQPLNPKEITPGSEKKAWWLCSLGHVWQSSIRSRCKGSKCPFCHSKKKEILKFKIN